MARRTKETTIVSSKGQVILPKEIGDQRQWEAGTRLIVEDMEAGVLLTRAPLFPKTDADRVFGMLAYNGPPKTLEEMEQGVLDEAKRRARD
jgi:AbrB family looped-hinge helix DNA binding protein